VRRRSLAAGAGMLLLALGLAPQASAQVQTHPADRFALNGFYPSAPGSTWLVADSLRYEGHKRVTLGLVFDWGRKPLVLYGPAGSETALVSDQFYAHLGGSILLYDRFRLALSIPVILYQNGSTFYVDDTEYIAPHGLDVGDIRASVDGIIWRRSDGVVRLAGGMRFFIPSAGRDSYASDGAVRIEPYLAVAGDVGPFTYAGRLGVQYRAQSTTFAGAALGSQFLLDAAAGYQTPYRRLLVGAELYGSTVFSEGESYFATAASPLELLLMARWQLPHGWAASLGFAPGLTRALGTPRFRTLASVEWAYPSL
jgi:hypothetical protein